MDGGLLQVSNVDPLIGTTVAKHYVIDACIGEGGMARVYRAHHARLAHKQFAVKVMFGDLAATLEMRLRFAQEADAASQLSHPNVVAIVDFGKTETGLMFLAMELVEGRSLAAIIDTEAPMRPERALALVRQICLGLGHAHAHGLVHRDLKPDNVLVTADDIARIVDFGLAIPADDERSTRLTRVGIALGTPIYAAPEQTHNDSVDHRADLFALGVTLFEMLAGRVPFDGGVVELVRANASDAPPSIEARSGVVVPVEVEQIVRRLMRRDPAARFADATAVIAAIDAALRAPVEVVALPPAPRRSRGRLAVALAAIGGAAFAAVALALPPDRGPPTTVATVATVAPVAPIAVPAPAVVAPPVIVPTPTPAPMPAPPPTLKVPPPVIRTRREPARVEPSHVRAASPAVEAAIEPPPVTPPPPTVPIESPPVVPPTPALPRPPVVAVTPPLWTTATVRVASLVVRGSLADADVRRAIERLLPAVQDCYRQTARAASRSPAATVHLTLAVDNTRRASAIQAASTNWPQLAACVGTAARALRTQSAPDVGDAAVVVDLAFQPVSP